MNSKTKALAIILGAIAVCMLIYAPLTQAAQPTVALGDEEVYAEMEQSTNWRFRAALRVRFAYWFLNHSEPVQVEGTVVALSGRKLILNTAQEQIRVILPGEWTVDNTVLTREELFTSGYLSEGNSITVKTVSANVINKDGLRIYLQVGYEIINTSGVHATANLRVNIET